MTLIDPTLSLADLVVVNPSAAAVLDAYELDYCCNGGRTLADACADRGVDPAAVTAALASLGAAEAGEDTAWTRLGPAELADHLEATHHAYLHEALPRLDALGGKVLAVHGGGHPELQEVVQTLRALRADLEPHLRKEEVILFPAIRALAAAGSAAALPFPSVLHPIRVMHEEHDRAGELLAVLRHRTGGYATPADGCASYRAFYDGLRELEADTHRHIHKENAVLFPAALAAEHAG